MSDPLNVHAKWLLRQLIKKSGKDISMSKLVDDLVRIKDRVVNRNLMKTLNDIFVNDSIAYQLFKDTFHVHLRTHRPIDSLRKLLEEYGEKTAKRKSSPSLTGQHKSIRADAIPEEPLTTTAAAAAATTTTTTTGTRTSDPVVARSCRSASHEMNARPNETISSMSTPITSHNVSDIVKKVCKAASDGLSKSAKNSPMNVTAATDGGSGGSDASAIHDVSAAKVALSSATPNVRPHSLWYFNKATYDAIMATSHDEPNCFGVPFEQQEQLIIDDLLYCFIGIPGAYIKPIITNQSESTFGPITFKISDHIDVSLRDIAKDILPMASHYSVIQKFAQWGSRVNNQIVQALSAALQEVINQYYASVIQLETEQSNLALNLHKLMFFVRPNMQALEVLAHLLGKIGQQDLLGGRILTILHEHITLSLGDLKSQEMFIELTERAALPYIEMLQLWILKGVIIDEYNQFFVVDHGKQDDDMMVDGDTARYWESRYTIKRERIPTFLENDADIILRTGKYLNVIRQCGHRIRPPADLAPLEYSANSQKHSAFIKSAYHHASRTLLTLLEKQYCLMGHISSAKRYFLLQQGDLITQFMDASEEELSKNVDKVAPVRLDNLLQLIVRLSSAKNDPCLDHLHCDLLTMDLLTQMSKIHEAGTNDMSTIAPDDNDNPADEIIDLIGLECFVFQYNVQWPVSIVLNQWALSQYQMLFRLLFYCKHVERQLCKIWIENTYIRNLAPEMVDQWRCAFALRQRMLDAVQHLENYMMIEVIEPNWHVFVEKMRSVQNIDDVIGIHHDFLHLCLQNCMLNHPELLRNVINMCNVCLKFCKFIQLHSLGESLQTFNEFADEFTGHLIELMVRINDISTETTHGAKLNNLVCRINFNGFYNGQLDKITATKTIHCNDGVIRDEVTYMAV